jgi:hypothetical protein
LLLTTASLFSTRLKRLAQRFHPQKDANRPNPDETFISEKTMKLGGKTVELTSIAELRAGRSHTSSSWRIHSALLPASALVAPGGSKAIRKAQKWKCEPRTVTTGK